MERFLITNKDFSSLLQLLFDRQYISKVLGAVENKKRYILKPEILSEKAKCENFPLSQLLVYSYGRTDSLGTTILRSHISLTEKIAVIGHACDIRALVELHKKMQAKWENLFTFCFEDHGFIEVKTMIKLVKDQNINENDLIGERLTKNELILKFKNGNIQRIKLNKDIDVCDNCTRCISKVHPLSDFIISTYGISEEFDHFILTPQSNRAIELIKELNWNVKIIDEKLLQIYKKEAEEIIDRCNTKREKDLNEWASTEDKLKLFAKCTGCGLCVTSCPVCFCVSCNLLPQVKAKTMNTLTFVTTRFTHVGDTCIECGKCGSNCPVNVPLTLVFQSLRYKFKKNRNYEAGNDLNKKPLHLDI